MDMITRLEHTENFSYDGFRQADPLLQPAYTWVWNAPLDHGAIISQLDDMVRAGIRCMYILPEPKEFRPCTRRYHMAQEYLTEAYFETVRFAAEEALKRGIALWLYDEGGWPSGGACGRVIREHPELCRKTLAMRCIRLEAGECYTAGEHALAAFDMAEEKPVIIEPGKVMSEAKELKEYYVRWIDGNNTDPLDRDLADAFVGGTHEGYTRYLGDLFGQKNPDGTFVPGSSGVQMMFTDEPGTGRFGWPRGFEDDFRARFGYDILPFLPFLLDDPDDLYGHEVDGAEAQARIDCHQLAGEMFRDRYFVPIHEWCRRNNLLSTGHLDQDHLTESCLYHRYGNPMMLLREMDVPGVDVIWRQIDMPKNGEKPCPEGNGFFPRFASSAAAQVGRRFVMSESFAVYGGNLSGEEMNYIMNYQLVRGVNIFNFMIFSCGAESAIPLIFRPAFRPEVPGFTHLRAINDATARACFLMQLGRAGTDTALYYPLRDIWAGGDTGRNAVRAFESLGQWLERTQVDFDILDDNAVRDAHIEDGALCIGLAKYRHVLIPACRYLPDDVCAVLEKIDHQALPVLRCDNKSLRVRTRVLDDGGVLTMLFNESGKEETMRVSLPGKAPLYRLLPDCARVEKAAEPDVITLRGGEARYYLRTDMPLAAQDAFIPGACLAEITEFSLQRRRAMLLDPAGMHEKLLTEEAMPCTLGAWTEYVGADFSGEACYYAEITPDTPLQAGRQYALSLGKVENTARIRLDGQDLGVLWASPMTVTFDGASFEGKTTLKLEIEVANTMANQVNALPISDMYPPEDLSQYHAKLTGFERSTPPGGLYGPVRLLALEKGFV